MPCASGIDFCPTGSITQTPCPADSVCAFDVVCSEDGFGATVWLNEADGALLYPSVAIRPPPLSSITTFSLSLHFWHYPSLPSLRLSLHFRTTFFQPLPITISDFLFFLPHFVYPNNITNATKHSAPPLLSFVPTLLPFSAPASLECMLTLFSPLSTHKNTRHTSIASTAPSRRYPHRRLWQQCATKPTGMLSVFCSEPPPPLLHHRHLILKY